MGHKESWVFADHFKCHVNVSLSVLEARVLQESLLYLLTEFFHLLCSFECHQDLIERLCCCVSKACCLEHAEFLEDWKDVGLDRVLREDSSVLSYVGSD
jgi:hypothetical protein